jgi:hypothetical protein
MNLPSVRSRDGMRRLRVRTTVSPTQLARVRNRGLDNLANRAGFGNADLPIPATARPVTGMPQP